MEEESDESANKTFPLSRQRSYIKHENDLSFQNTARTTSEIDSIPKFNSFESTLFQGKSRSNNRLNLTNEVEYETQNLALKHTISTDSLTSRRSRNYSSHSPLGSFRSIRNSTRNETNRNGINIIMVIGFAIVIAFEYVFSKIEVFLKWFQFKLNELQLHFFEGKSISEFYAQEQSTARKYLYSPLSGLYYISQALVYVFLKTFEILKKPAPKTLVKNVFTRYIKD